MFKWCDKRKFLCLRAFNYLTSHLSEKNVHCTWHSSWTTRTIFCWFFTVYEMRDTCLKKIWSQSNHKHIISLFNSSALDIFLMCYANFLASNSHHCQYAARKVFLRSRVRLYCFILHQQNGTHETELKLTKLFNYSMVECLHLSRMFDKQACCDRFVICDFSTCRRSLGFAATLNPWHVKLWPTFSREKLENFIFRESFFSLCHFVSYLEQLYFHQSEI